MSSLSLSVLSGRLQTRKALRCKGKNCGAELVVGPDGKDPHCPNARCDETRSAGTNLRCPETTCGSSDLRYHSPTAVVCERGHLIRLSAPLLGC